jgi:acid phosphatase type 7
VAHLRSLALGIGAVWLLLALGAAPARAQGPVIAAAGDIACDPNGASFNNGDGEADRCRQKYTSDLLVGAGLAAVLPLGDTQYEDGTLEQFQGSYDLSWGRVKDITRPVIGNHEYHFGSGYWDYFNGVGITDGPAGERGKGWYSFDVGSWHLIALNSMCPEVGGCGAGSEQEQWLREDLAANSDAGCTVAYWHHPLFNSGPDGNYKDTPWNTTDLWQALYAAGADLVLNGHSHRYERFSPQDPLGNADPQFGLREFIVGTGGRSLGLNGPLQPNLELRDNTQFGVIRLVLHPNGYDWTFVNDSGVTRDTGSASCHGSPPPDTAITSGPTGTINTRSAAFSFTSSEAGSTFKCKLDGPGTTPGTETSCSSPQPYSNLANGTYTFSVYATDATGSADPTPATRSFTVDVDTVAPNTSINSATFKKNSATFSFSSTETGSRFTCRLDSGPGASCTSPRTYNGLSAGGHTFYVYATDAAGNADPTPATYSFTITKGGAKSSSASPFGSLRSPIAT